MEHDKLKQKTPADLLRVEAAYIGEKLIGLRLTTGTSEPVLVFADQGVMVGFRCGPDFVPGMGERIEYRDVAVGEAVEQKKCTIPPPGWMCTRAAGHEGPCAAIEEIPPVGSSEWAVRGYLAATLKCWHRLSGDEAAELVAMTQRLAGLYPFIPASEAGEA